MKFNKKVVYLSVFLILALFLISACKEYNGIKLSEDGDISQPPRCIDCAAPNLGCRYVLQSGEDPCKTCGKLVCGEEEGPVIETLRSASVLNLPLPENSKCFYQENREKPECSKFYIQEGDSKNLACPQYYNPVCGEDGLFYPSACWAEQLGTKVSSYGYCPSMKKFISDLWLTKKADGKSYYVPDPDMEFTYGGSGLIDIKTGTWLRSSLWKNTQEYLYQ